MHYNGLVVVVVLVVIVAPVAAAVEVVHYGLCVQRVVDINVI